MSKLLIVCALFFYSSLAFSQTTADGIIFDAEDAVIQNYDKNNQVIKLRKKVQIIYQGRYLSCDEASIQSKDAQMTCKGNVRLVGPDIKMECEELSFNYKTNTGEIKKGFVQVGQVVFEGDLIRKLGEYEYETVQGTYTACTNCPAFWSFRGSKVDAEIGGYAYISNALIYFGKVPAFWFPYMIVPLKSERQTGLLFPSFGYSNTGGFKINQSFFWAMDDSYDSTWTVKHYGFRGTKGLLNYRYILSPDSKGEFNYAFMKDKVFSESDEIRPYNPDQSTLARWFVQYNHYYDMPYGFIQRAQINAISDTLYPRDFNDEMPGRGDSSLENRVSLTKNTENLHWSIEAGYYKSLLTEDPLENNSDSVHRFPEMNLSLSPTRILNSNFLFQFNANYLNLSRDKLSYDDLDASKNPVAPNGQYDSSTDLIRTGQRFDIEPEISYPINFGTAFSLLPSISYRQTEYRFPIGEDPSATRNYLRTNVSARTQFSKIFDTKNPSPISTRYKHIIQPEISHTAIPWDDQDDHPFFADKNFDSNFRRDSAINNSDQIQFDYRDRVYDKNLVTYSFTNKILRKRYENGTPRYLQIISHKLFQSYDVHERNRDTPDDKQPWSEIGSLLDLRFDHFETNWLAKYYPYQKETAHSARVKVFDSRNNYFEVIFSQDFLITGSNQINLSSKTRDLIFGAGITSKYMDFIGSTTFNILNDSLQSYRYGVRIKPPGDCWAITFSQERQTDAQIEYDFNIQFSFDGKFQQSI